MGRELKMASGSSASPSQSSGARLKEKNTVEFDTDNYFLEKFTLYETRARFYMVGRDKAKVHFRVLKIDRSEPAELNISEDPVVYTQEECINLLQRVAQGNLATGGLTKVTKAYGIVGFTQYLESYYMILVTKHRQIGMLCGHAIYAIEESQMITVPHSSVQTDVANSKTELRYKKLLSGVDLTKDFFFSYTYRIMQSLQRNVLVQDGESLPYENMFVWNAFLTRGIRERLNNTRWTVALVHGFFEQAKFSIFGRIFVITLISRRSRHFAGTRYLKRGVNDKGKVANDVETEQIVLDEECGFGTTLGQMSSVVQNRGSIPLFWSQEASRLSPKPDIILHRIDPIYKATALHFEDLEQRYGNPIIILNLIKTVEKRPREMMLRREFATAVGYLNNILAEESRLKFIHWDFHKFAKSKSANVLPVLGAVAGEALDLTGIYYSGKPSVAKRPSRLKRSSTSPLKNMLGRGSPPAVPEPSRDFGTISMTGATTSARDSENDCSREKKFLRSKEPQFQRGVLRTNCIDCLDRTNIAQFACGLAAAGRQLYALGLTDTLKLDAGGLFGRALGDMYKRMGDAIALQYGGSAAHNTVFPERQGKWRATTQSREFLKSIKRYYSNTYTDGEKQDAINLFLGHFQPKEGKPALWELDSDYYLHVGGYGDESPREANRVEQNIVDPMLRQNLSSALAALPSYRADYHHKKLTSFDKLLNMTCGPLKNVRMYMESELKVGAQSATAPAPAPDAAEVQLRSPNWLYGQPKIEDPNPTKAETSESSASKTGPDNQATRDFSEFDWLSSCGLREKSICDSQHPQYLMSEEVEEGWDGTSLLTDSDFKEEVDVDTSSEDSSDFLFVNYINEDDGELKVKGDDVEAAMEEALKEYQDLGVDVASILPGGKPSVEFTSSFARWLFRPDVEGEEC
ncbi:phosphatidylinositol 3,5-bisphosphate 5-phosphatase [Marchantia polymorpha subsp. ruderalis]|uniref:SAC domain-containing protein n=2 Tax=Marchantia polymorpha TaxID=3197 RepID=A0AAF6ARU0_MARPO|nr:hypothetical protein MARPO_0001s0261 [Marchantia polymorpha]BBM99160.1 hypothetical protein Mp_1g19230 [Marchantia polymorpha subsp. ruderalis]|eukprot:PTQ50237.1 hypothetical protein MARPO_0001s0261 [Marchantia polymorpha]